MCLAHILACTWKNVAVACVCTLRSLILGSEVCVVQLTQGLNVVGSCGVLLRIFTSSSDCFLLKMSCHSGNIYSCPYLYLLLFIFASCSKGSSCSAFSNLTNLLFFAFFWKSTLQQFLPYQSKKSWNLQNKYFRWSVYRIAILITKLSISCTPPIPNHGHHHWSSSSYSSSSSSWWPSWELREDKCPLLPDAAPSLGKTPAGFYNGARGTALNHHTNQSNITRGTALIYFTNQYNIVLHFAQELRIWCFRFKHV